MTSLTIYADAAPYDRIADIADFAGIAETVATAGVGLERWAAAEDLTGAADDAAILAAYSAEISALKARGGYQAVDVVRLTPDHPARAEMRARFLAEHVHDDDEVRFFVEGSGLFYIRHGGRVLALECTAGDLVVLPAGTRHWFDTGAEPLFAALRLFSRPEGWAARFTGDAIAEAIPLYERAA